MSEPLAARRRDVIASLAIVLALCLYALFAGAYGLRLMTLAGCYAIAVIGYQRLFGDLGLLSLAQGAFFAVGAYGVAILNAQGIGDMALALPLAVAAAVALALLCAVPLLRLGSHYLALASLALAMLVLLGAVNLDRFTGGANGLVLSPPRWFGASVVDNGVALVVVWIAVIGAALLYWRSGSGLKALRRQLLRQSPRAAAAIGLDAQRWRGGAFVFAAALAALGGGLYAPVAGVISPQVAELGLMVNLLAASVIGGRGKVAGALLGALLLVLVPEALRFAGNWYLFLWGAALLVMLILAPDGVAGALDALLRKLVKPRWIVERAAQPAATIPDAQLRIANLRKAFGGVVAVDDVSFEMRGGEAVVVIGPNGAGKTTLLNLLCGTEAAGSGAVFWAGHDIAPSDAASHARAGIARSFQTSQLPPDQAAIDAVACGAPDGLGLAQARGAALALLDQLGLGDQARQPVRQLAPAARRLVEIARAMIGRPALLALDEPTAGMNEAERRQLLAVLRRWRAEGLALFVIEHDIGFASSLADRLCCLEAGRIVAAGDPAALLADAKLARFFGRFAA